MARPADLPPGAVVRPPAAARALLAYRTLRMAGDVHPDDPAADLYRELAVALAVKRLRRG